MPVTVTPTIPEFITVHLGPANAWAENVTVTFPDYIKNVASSEIYPTWENAALRANILAQISFALNRIYTEYYRSRGYDFDITSSTTTDQKFINGRNTFENVDQLVDELFNDYIRRIGFVEPLSARFCNGTTVTCDGLSQWGSQELAQEGYDSISILRNYYGDNIELVINAPIQNMPESYPGTPLQLGSQGSEVVVLQSMLNRISQNYPAIPKVWPVDGIFGSATEEAVKKFQSIFNLTSDGIVGRATWYKLVFLYVGVKNLSELVSEGQTFYKLNIPNEQILQEGDRGEEVTLLQYMLSMLGQFVFQIPFVSLDGIFGSQTQQAVIAVQNALGLPATGVVDRATWEGIYRAFMAIEDNVTTRKELFPALSSTGTVPSPTEAVDYARTTRMTQFPGQNLSLGDQDTGGGAIV